MILSTYLTMFVEAAQRGDNDKIQEMMRNGIIRDVDMRDEIHMKTALTSATLNRHTETMKIILANGADPNALDISGNTMLLIAIRNKDISGVKALVENGADVNKADMRREHIPLLEAIQLGQNDICEFLMTNNAKVDYYDGNKMLLKAIIHCSSSVVELVIEKTNKNIVNESNQNGKTPLLEATSMRRIDVMEILLKNGADVNISDYNGRTPLMYASVWWTKSGVELLLKYGAKVDMVNRKGVTALMVATKRGVKETVELLLAEANPNIVNAYGFTALDIANRFGHKDIIDMLSEKTDIVTKRICIR